MSEFSEQMNGVREKLERENKHGGELTDKPCPFCGKPRSQRSTYIRCNRCGVNWLNGVDLSRDPRLKPMPVTESTPTDQESGAQPVSAPSEVF